MIIYYHDDVKEFIVSLEKPARSKILRLIVLLERYGFRLGMPYAKKAYLLSL